MTVPASHRHASSASPHAVMAVVAGVQETSHWMESLASFWWEGERGRTEVVSADAGKARNCEAGMMPTGAAMVMFSAKAVGLQYQYMVTTRIWGLTSASEQGQQEESVGDERMHGD